MMEEVNKPMRIIYYTDKKQVNGIKNRVKNSNRFKSESELIRTAVNNLLSKNVKQYILVYIFYPAIFFCFAYFGSAYTQNLNEILLVEKMYFHELYLLNRIFNIICFGTVAVLAISLYILKKKLEKD